MIRIRTTCGRIGTLHPPSVLGMLVLFLMLATSGVFAGTVQEDPAEDPTAGLARKDARIRDLALFLESDSLKASARITGAFIREVRDHVDSGLPLTFTYTVELYKKKKYWFDRRLLHRKVETRVLRDNITGRYALSLLVDGEEISHSTTKDENVMRAWMSTLDRIDLIQLSEVPVQEVGDSSAGEPAEKRKNKEGKKPDSKKKDKTSDSVRLYLRVKAKIKDDFVFFFIPWDFEAGWAKLVLHLDEIRVVPPPPERPLGAAKAHGKAGDLRTGELNR